MANSTLAALLTTRYGQWKRPIAAPDTFQARDLAVDLGGQPPAGRDGGE